MAAVKAGNSVYRCTLADLVDSLSLAHRAGQLANKLRFYTRASLLIVDEIGYLPLPKEGANLFFQLVSARYEKGAMILTSNRSFAEWADVFGDPVVATALLESTVASRHRHSNRRCQLSTQSACRSHSIQCPKCVVDADCEKTTRSSTQT